MASAMLLQNTVQTTALAGIFEAVTKNRGCCFAFNKKKKERRQTKTKKREYHEMEKISEREKKNKKHGNVLRSDGFHLCNIFSESLFT